MGKSVFFLKVSEAGYLFIIWLISSSVKGGDVYVFLWTEVQQFSISCEGWIWGWMSSWASANRDDQ